MPGSRRALLAAGLVLALYSALSCAYALKAAPGNAPDERPHAEYVMHLMRHGSLPRWNWPSEPESREATQPPLYYFVASLALRPFAGLPPMAQFRILRIASSLWHVAALALLFAMARRLGGGASGALGPLCCSAFLPMFLFIGASVTNDAAANFAGAALLWFSLRREEGVRAGEAWGLGALWGFALLCKATVLPPIAVSLAALWEGTGRRKGPFLRGAGKAALAAALLGGWFYFRNVVVYGDPLGPSAGGGRGPSGYDPDRYAWEEIGKWGLLFFQSFWGRFGQMTQPMPDAAYWLLAGLSTAAAAGWARRWRGLIEAPGRKLLLLALGLALAQNFVYGFIMSYQPQARYSFAALSAWAVLFWDGLTAATAGWPARRRNFAALGLASLGLFVHLAAWKSL